LKVPLCVNPLASITSSVLCRFYLAFKGSERYLSKKLKGVRVTVSTLFSTTGKRILRFSITFSLT
jgi:hypothetical protein